MTKRPPKTLRHVLQRLEEIQDEHEREGLQKLAPVQRAACPEHGWHPPGPGSLNMDALKAMCPHCREERKQKRREEETPETRTIDFGALPESSMARKLWGEAREAQAKAGIVVAGSLLERELLRTIVRIEPTR